MTYSFFVFLTIMRYNHRNTPIIYLHAVKINCSSVSVAIELEILSRYFEATILIALLFEYAKRLGLKLAFVLDEEIILGLNKLWSVMLFVSNKIIYRLIDCFPIENLVT